MTTRIVRTKDTLHGKPRLDGTRWLTEIAHHFNYDVVQIMAEYPHLSRQQIDAACKYERSLRRKIGRRVDALKMRLAVWALGFDIDDERGSGR